MGGIDLAESIREVSGLVKAGAKKVERVEARDRVFLVNHESGTIEEVLPRLEDLSERPVAAKVLDVESLADWARAFGPSSRGELHLNRRGDSVAYFPRMAKPYEQRSICQRPFFRDFLPSGQWVELEEFQGWLDKVRPGMSGETRDLVDLAFGSVSATSSQVVEMQVDGAVIQVDVKAGDKIGGKRQLPRHITALVPFGDPALRLHCRFIISARIKDGKVHFRATHDEQDGAFEAWVQWARQRLTELLPETWVVLVTP